MLDYIDNAIWCKETSEIDEKKFNSIEALLERSADLSSEEISVIAFLHFNGVMLK